MKAERKAGLILGGIALIECAWVAFNLWASGWRFVRYLGFAPGLYGNIRGWIAAVIVITLFAGFALRLPSVRETVFRISWLKMLAAAVAIGAGILEEVFFRRWTMNWLMSLHHGAAVQVLGSAVLFGLAHGVWGLFGKSLSAAAGATLSTGALGAMLAMVFLLAGRSLAPCIAAHFIINLLIEPGLVLAAVRGEMKRLRR